MLERAINNLASRPVFGSLVISFIAATILMVGTMERLPLP